MNDPTTQLGAEITKLAQSILDVRSFDRKTQRVCNELSNLGQNAQRQGRELSTARTTHLLGLADTLKSIAENAAEQLRNVTTKMRTLELENQRLRDQPGSDNAGRIRRLRNRITDLEEQITSLEDENDRLRTRRPNPRPRPGTDRRIIELESQVELLKTEKNSLESEKSTLEQEKRDLQRKIDELNEEVGKMTKCQKCQSKKNHPCEIRRAWIRF